MKRKLDENDVPQALAVSTTNSSPSFANYNLDPRLLQAVNKKAWATPTPVQQAVIPTAEEGKDILARAKTGSGKTAAYLLPIINAILRRKSTNAALKQITALILVPTRELAEQVSKVVSRLLAFCSSEVSIANLAQKTSDSVQRSSLALLPDIVVATPARVALNVNTTALSLDDIVHVVIDEADLVLSYGYEEDLQIIQKALPPSPQILLMSATLSTEVDSLKGMFCKDPVIIALDEQEAKEENGVTQYIVKCAEDEKFLLAYVIFKLKLVKGKTIIFVGDIDRSYRLKLFLEQFGIKSCVLNSELPVNSRLHVVEEFNKNIYELLIASDEQEALGDEGSTRKPKRRKKLSDGVNDSPSREFTDIEPPVSGDDADNAAPVKKKSRRSAKPDKEYGISRGIDFQNVTTIFNFDFPTSPTSYTHRIGRTARAGRSGMAMSLVIPSDQYRKHKPTSFPSTQYDEKILAQITEQQEALGKELKPHNFDMSQVDAFRYRMNDALRAVTQVAVREARVTELRQELLKSEKLKRHFEENPDDLRHLRHDGELRAARIQPHLKHVPNYLMPRTGKEGIVVKDAGFVGIGKVEQNRIRKARAFNKARGKGAKKSGKGLDPLKTFNARGRK